MKKFLFYGAFCLHFAVVSWYREKKEPFSSALWGLFRRLGHKVLKAPREAVIISVMKTLCLLLLWLIVSRCYNYYILTHFECTLKHCMQLAALLKRFTTVWYDCLTAFFPCKVKCDFAQPKYMYSVHHKVHGIKKVQKEERP